MRVTRGLFPTLKEAPKEATTPSHILLLRGGYIRLVSAGIYELLPMGLRVVQGIARIVREEMDRAGAQEILMPALLPAEYFRETGRWDGYGQELFRLHDRKAGEYHLAPTHEEVVTDLARRELRSYRQLPRLLYQIQQKYRDEPRPRAGLLRCREFLMKDAYSFDRDAAGARRSYDAMEEVYRRVFARLELDYRVVEASSGAMGGGHSAEFQILTQQGEDALVACTRCDYAANVEVARIGTPPAMATAPSARDHVPPIEELHTPGAGGIEAVVRAVGSGLEAKGMQKCLLFRAGGEIVMAVVRGNRELAEAKLAQFLGVPEVELASSEEVQAATGATLGFAGPVGFSGRVIVDQEILELESAVTGANRSDTHLKNVVFGRDFDAPVADLRRAEDGDVCPRCGGSMTAYRGVEGGHVFILGTRYSAPMRASFVDEAGKEQPFVMGCYGIGLTRLVAAIAEQHLRDGGVCWPLATAPYALELLSLGQEPAVVATADKLYAACEQAGISVLYDDRDERPGRKFKDADLFGAPWRLAVGKRALLEGKVELTQRFGAAAEPQRVTAEQALAMIQSGS